jgi:formylmethanofuran dehydrogenase subunit E
MEEVFDQIKQFHGHVGPYAIIGYKMGLIANKNLGADPFCKKVVVWTDTNPPLSCVIDGIQLSSGCTLGKGSITIEKGEIPKALFEGNNGKQIQITLKTNVKDEIDANVTNNNIERYSEVIFKRSDPELFKINIG